MAVDSNAIANQAIQFMGDNQPPVTGLSPTFDNSPAGIALQSLYAPTVATIARQWEWDLARSSIALVLSGNVAPLPWAIEYLYPPNGIEVWQLVPSALVDVNNPLPINWNVGNAIVLGSQAKVIWTNLAAARCVYNNNPTEATWDPLFREAVVRLLASELAMAIAGRPDSAQALIESGAAFESLGEGRSN